MNRDEGPLPDDARLGRDSLGRDEAKLPSKDITPVLRGWDYEAGTINVRKIAGMDGRPKLQMRVDLGLLQMEMSGRPDGARPHGCESLLDYYERELAEFKAAQGTDLGFHLTREQCQDLREEAVMYYQRYLGLFVLEDFRGVIRDTARNLRVLDLCGKFATDEQDRLILEQYRPYIIMMNTRADASIHYNNKNFKKALDITQGGLEKMKEFFASFGQEEAYAKSNEARVLKRFAKEIRRKIPVDPITKLSQQLERAVKTERYEEAARLRDELKRVKR
jgi:hypothetical protein